MFAIYDIEGLRFRDTLENLRKVEGIKNSTRARASDKTFEGEQRPIADAASTESGGVPIPNKAVHAYREMLQLNRREPIFHASQLMSHPVSTVPMDMGILAAQRYFHQQGLRHMPVLSVEQRIVGMLSIEDLMQFIVIDDGHVRYVEGKRVADAMSQQVITADPVSDVRRIAQVMLEYHLYSVPIVDEMDKLIGIVARSDILRAVMNDPPLNMWS
jgi:CBS-domain-containing membrane protein